jgi:hypothetical protein
VVDWQLLSSSCGTVGNAMRELGLESVPAIDRARQTVIDGPQHTKNKMDKRNGMMERNDGNI